MEHSLMYGTCKGLLNRSQGFALPLPGLHLKSDGSGFRAVHESRELRSQRRFTGSFGTHPCHARSSHRVSENFAARTRIAVARVTSHELIKHSQLIATHA